MKSEAKGISLKQKNIKPKNVKILMNELPNNLAPPKGADKLLIIFLPDDLAEELQGDMHEQFERQVEEVGLTKAKLLYVWEVLRFCRPYFLKRRLLTKTDTVKDNYS